MPPGRAISVTPAAPPAHFGHADRVSDSASATANTCSRADASGAVAPVVEYPSTTRESASSLSDVFSEHAAHEDLRSPRRPRRIPAADPNSTVAVSEPGSSADRHEATCSQPPAAVQQPSAIPSAISLLERFKVVFLSGEDSPVATADGGVAQQATIALVLAVRDAVKELWEAHEADIKRVCGPFMPKGLLAKQEVFGFALADALGRPVLPGDRAMRVGQNGDNAVRVAEGSKDRTGKLTAARETARSAVRKAQRAADKDPALEPGVAAAKAAGEAAITAVLAMPIDLVLPNETVGAKRKRATVAAPAEAEPKLAELRQSVRVAQAAVRAAEEAHGVAKSRASRAQRQLDGLGSWPSWSDAYDAEEIDWVDCTPEEAKAADARVEARHASACAPFERAQERLFAARSEERASSVALFNAESTLRAAQMAVHHAEEMEQWEREEAERDELRAENAKLRQENAVLREETEALRMIVESHERLAEMRVRAAEEEEHRLQCALYGWSEDEGEDEWDEVQAEEEMRRMKGPVGNRSL